MNATEPKVVTLRTGAEVPEPLVKTALIAIARLNEINPVALIEAYEVARDKTHPPFGNTGEVLREIGLLERDGTMHDGTRDVLLATVADFEDYDFHLVSPFPSTEATS